MSTVNLTLFEKWKPIYEADPEGIKYQARHGTELRKAKALMILAEIGEPLEDPDDQGNSWQSMYDCMGCQQPGRG